LQKAVELDERAAKSSAGTAAPNYHFHLGMALKAKGDKVAARRELELAMRLGEKAPFAEAAEAHSALANL